MLRTIISLALLLALLAPRLSARQEAVRERELSIENSSTDPLLSPQLYPGLVRESRYLVMRDGVRLAADIYRPARDQGAVAEPLPVIWTHDRYQRAREGHVGSKMDQPHLREMVRRGYVVGDVDARGCGASFGTYLGPFSKTETEDAYEIVEWFAAQPWCNGKVGMFGGSYLGATQLLAASTKAPHLKAIVPAMAPGDLYAFSWAGGIFRRDFLEHWSELTRTLDTTTTPAAVDGDEDRSLLAAARKEHAGNRNTLEQFAALPFRDSQDAGLGGDAYAHMSSLGHLQTIAQSGVAIDHIAGWFDCFTRDAIYLYANLPAPQRIVIGPWFHQQNQEIDYFGEHIRWFDHWLKGIDNGVQDEPPIHYYTMGAKPGKCWRSSWEWPLANEQRTRYYFVAQQPPRAQGELGRSAPADGASAIAYRVDYATTSGRSNRWANGYGGPAGYVDLAPNDAKGMSFTTAPLANDIEVTGHPVAHLWVKSTAPDGDFFVYLEEVDGSGVSHYVTEGCLRASHRALHEAPYENFGLPYHRSFAADVAPLPEGTVELTLDLQPSSNIFDAGNRIRVTITGADRDNTETPVLSPPPVVTLSCDAEHPSGIELPIIPATEGEER
jgi:putative CocE/NonD family hydrolase